MIEKVLVLFFLVMAAIFSSMSVEALDRSYQLGQSRQGQETRLDVETATLP